MIPVDDRLARQRRANTLILTGLTIAFLLSGAALFAIDATALWLLGLFFLAVGAAAGLTLFPALSRGR